MSADSRDQDDGVLWMRERSTGSKVVRSRSGRGRNADSIGKEGGKMLVVTE